MSHDIAAVTTSEVAGDFLSLAICACPSGGCPSHIFYLPRACSGNIKIGQFNYTENYLLLIHYIWGLKLGSGWKKVKKQ